MTSTESSNVSPLAGLPVEILDTVPDNADQSSIIRLMQASRYFYTAARDHIYKDIVIPHKPLRERDGILQGRTLSLLQAVLRNPDLLKSTESLGIQERFENFLVSEILLDALITDAVQTGVRCIIHFTPDWQAEAVYPNATSRPSTPPGMFMVVMIDLYALVIEMLLLKAPELVLFALETNVPPCEADILFNNAPTSIRENLGQSLSKLKTISLSGCDSIMAISLRKFQNLERYVPSVTNLTVGESDRHQDQMFTFGLRHVSPFNHIKTLYLSGRNAYGGFDSMDLLFPAVTNLTVSLNLCERSIAQLPRGLISRDHTSTTREVFNSALKLHRQLTKLHIYNPMHQSPNVDRDFIIKTVEHPEMFPNIRTLVIAENVGIIKIGQGTA